MIEDLCPVLKIERERGSLPVGKMMRRVGLIPALCEGENDE